MINGKTILVVDDEEKIRSLLKQCFEADGYCVIEASDSKGVNDQLSTHEVSLVTLKLQLGNEDGLTIATVIKDLWDIPFIMITEKGDVIDKVVGLEMGADDYISKPFHIREVQARVKAVLRRSKSNGAPEAKNGDLSIQGLPKKVYEFSGWRADSEKYELVHPNGKACELTTTTFKLLMVFLTAPKKILSRDIIMDRLNGSDWSPFDRTVDNQVAHLRKTIEYNLTKPKIIKTIRGVGYMFSTDVTEQLPTFVGRIDVIFKVLKYDFLSNCTIGS
jgi:DNA-binding response OmpR family regulator